MNRNDWKKVKEKGRTYYISDSGGKPIPGEAETIFDDDFKHGAVLIFRTGETTHRGYYPCEMLSTGDQVERKANKLKECPQCGKNFKPRSGDQVYCSYDCFKAHREEMKKKFQKTRLGDEKICVVCGKTFKLRVPGQICCSPECSKERFRRISAEYRKRKRMKA